MQILKWLGISLLVLFTASYVYLYLRDKYDDRPFKFEKYKNSKEFEQGLEEKFPLGSSVERALELLKQSGTECEVFDHREDLNWQREHRYLLACQYNSGFFSLYPLANYRLYIYADSNLLIIKYFAEHTTGMVI